MTSNIDPTLCAFDGFRQSIASQLSKIFEVPEDITYPAVDLGKKGVDFTVALPRLRLKGAPKDFAEKFVQAVCALMFTQPTAHDRKP
jgi:arginyl-tRNA synthetase